MEIVVAKNSGFCPGVKKAVDTAFAYAGKNACVYGELIHNEKIISDLKKSGVETIENVSEINGRTVIIRAHGVKKSFYEYAKENGINIVDCTCSFVKKIHDLVETYYNKGYKIVVLGEAGHPEIVGTNGWCNDTALITKDFDEIEALLDEKLCIVAQTTFSNEKYEEISKKIKTLSNKKVEIFKTICYTTMVRQEEVGILARETDAVIVIGGAHSGNTARLYELAGKYNQNVFKISNSFELDKDKIKKFRKVGIVLGASTPSEQLQEVIQTMEITEVNVTPELNPETVAEPAQEVATQEVEVKKVHHGRGNEKTCKKAPSIQSRSSNHG